MIWVFVGGLLRVGTGGQPLDAQQPAAQSRDAVTTGEFFVEPPTLIDLGFEWFIHNNTILSETTGTTQNSHWRNNLMLGQNGLSVFSPTKLTLFGIRTYTNYTSSDYNGLGPAPDTTLPFLWERPPFSVVADIPSPDHRPVLETREYATLAEYSKATGQDRHSIPVDYDVFANVPRLDARKVETLQRIYDAATLDLRLRPGSAPVDRAWFCRP